MKRALGAMAAVIVLLPGTAAADQRSVQWSAWCQGAAVAVAVDARNVEPFIPDDLTIVGFGDQTVLIFQIFECRNGRTNDGEALPTFILGEIPVPVESGPGPCPNGSPRDEDGGDFYDIPVPLDSQVLHARYAALGLSDGMERGLTFTRIHGTTIEAEASVPGYSLSVEASPAPLPDDPAGGCCAWQLGSRGYVGFSFDITGGTLYLGKGTISAPSGSPVARMLGAEERSGVAAVRQFDVASLARLITC